MAHARIVSTATRYAHRISSGRHSLIADEPATLGGQDAGMAPFDLYLSSLAACTAITLRMYAEKKGWDLGEFSAELESSRDEVGKLLDVVGRTPVTLMMREGAVITSARG